MSSDTNINLSENARQNPSKYSGINIHVAAVPEHVAAAGPLPAGVTGKPGEANRNSAGYAVQHGYGLPTHS